MADDLDKKIKQIADMFGVSDTKSLKNIVESFAASSDSSPGKDSSPSKDSSTNKESFPQENRAYQNETSDSYPPPKYSNRNSSVDFLSKANEMMSMFNNVRDSRITLLHSVQPFLRPQRQERLGSAVQLLKIISIVSSMAPNNRSTEG